MARPCINVMAVGDAGCGKTCLFMRFSKNQFWDEHIPAHLHNGDVDIDNEDLDIIDKEVADIVFDRNELTLCYFNTSGETLIRLAYYI